MSQPGTAFMPEPGHQSWPQSPLALQVGRPSGGAHGGTFAFDGEHWGAACAVPAASPTAAAPRPPDMTAAAATAATRVRLIVCPFRKTPLNGVATDPGHFLSDALEDSWSQLPNAFFAGSVDSGSVPGYGNSSASR